MNNTTPASSLSLTPTAKLRHGDVIVPLLGLGLAPNPPLPKDVVKAAVMEAFGAGYRHFDTAALYGTEEPLGEAIREGVRGGLIGGREEVFVTSKLWCSDAHGDRVVPALKRSLENLKLEYVDLYLIHWPISSKPGTIEYPIKKEDFRPMNFKSVWAAMEDCQKLSLTRAIGVSNFSCKKLSELLQIATIPPAVNQVEVNPVWQQKKLIEYCKTHNILVTAFSPLGAIGTFYGNNRVLESEILMDIATTRGKTGAQVALRWAFEQGIAVVVKSFNKERMKQNLEIFDWELSAEDHEKIRRIPQSRVCTCDDYTSPIGPFRTLEELWDGEL
ncbi:hypothetical protein Droror1_Dr00018520 [Drosera rotundifolia]